MSDMNVAREGFRLSVIWAIENRHKRNERAFRAYYHHCDACIINLGGESRPLSA